VTSHMTPHTDNLTSKAAYYGFDKVQVGNGKLLPIKSIGNMCV